MHGLVEGHAHAAAARQKRTGVMLQRQISVHKAPDAEKGVHVKMVGCHIAVLAVLVSLAAPEVASFKRIEDDASAGVRSTQPARVVVALQSRRSQ